MNGKVHTAEELPVPPDLINPFVHHLELSSTYDKIKVSIFIIKYKNLHTELLGLESIYKNLALKMKRMPYFGNG